ncbi:MAG: 4Fe-4S dicluster domain-containing protein [Deltaproteobacteria bacterium]|nr:4Fe-4S dicluster domain-containing protein [Deltaproteobacteria bacterium]
MEKKSKTYWKIPETVTVSRPETSSALHPISEMNDTDFNLSRRSFMKLLGASMALMSASCRRPLQKIIPYVKQPKAIVPGKAVYYASTFAINNQAQGILVKTIEGRPVKIEGNPDHPRSQGASSAFAQASLYELYDPQRKRDPTIQGNPTDWKQWLTETGTFLSEARRQKKKIRLLTETTTSPTLRNLYAKFEKAYGVQWFEFEPLSQERVRAAHQASFGHTHIPIVHLDKANIIVSLNQDFLGPTADALTHARNWTQNRKLSSDHPMNRLYVIESGFSLTGANADHRLSKKPSELLKTALSLAKILVQEFQVPTSRAAKEVLNKVTDPATSFEKQFLMAIASDVTQNMGSSLIWVGEQESKELQCVGHYLNSLLKAYGTVIDQRVFQASYDNGFGSIEPLLQELKSDQIDVFITIGGNPVYYLNSEYENHIKKIPHTIRLCLFEDETAKISTYVAPLSHALESWGDAEPETGLLSLIQPTIQPLHDSKLTGDILLNWLQKGDWHDHLRDQWEQHVYSNLQSVASFDVFWQEALRAGVVLLPPTQPQSFVFQDAILKNCFQTSEKASQGLELMIQPSFSTYDGRFAPNGWLQELPDPVTKVTWDNVLAMSPKTAEKFGLRQENKLELRSASGAVELPVFIQPGLAEGVITTTMGYGRTAGSEIAKNVGSNIFTLGPQLYFTALEFKKLRGTHRIAGTQGHDSMAGRPLVLEATLEEFKKHPDFAQHAHPPLQSLYEEHVYAGHRWGMTIDLNACIGCSGCVVACDVENNVPIVGKKQVLKGREMHWLRLDRYYEGHKDNPRVVSQPMLCQHCENAPCESVCPVLATTHSEEGLNEMTYNRCVGTRYCSNNCPYKVRRFNFFDFNADLEHPQELGKNPSVTVRMRGIMEKCTFCVHRINDVKIDEKLKGNDRVPDGKMVTACQQSCPSQAIVFGDLNDPHSQVSKLSKQSRGYHVLEEYDTKPSITYLAKIRNPHPLLKNLEGEHA